MSHDTGERELLQLPLPGMSKDWTEWAEALIAQLQPNLLQLNSTALVPTGAIIGWSGTTDDIPPGWELYSAETAATFIYIIKL